MLVLGIGASGGLAPETKGVSQGIRSGDSWKNCSVTGARGVGVVASSIE